MSRKATIVAGTLIFTGITLTAGALAIYKYVALHGPPPPTHVPSESVEVVEARQVQWNPTADLVGTVFALRSVSVRNELAGRVTAVKFESGTVVEAGDTLLTFDDSSDRADLVAAQAEVRVAQANVAVADARVRLAESELNRLTTAVASNAVSEMEVDRAASELDRAKADRERLVAEVDAANARVAQVQARLDKLVLKAPFRGRTGIRTVHEGQFLAEGSDVVMLEEVSDRIYLDFAIPQDYIDQVQPGTAVMATGDLLGDAPVRIEVMALDATVNNSTRNVRVRAIVNNPGERLRPGMFVQIRVPVDEPKPYIVVPATAVRRASYADQVYVVAPDADGPPGQLKAHQRFVTLGPSVGEDVIVLKGVDAGERVAATGSFKLSDGALVIPVEVQSAHAAAAVAQTRASRMD